MKKNKKMFVLLAFAIVLGLSGCYTEPKEPVHIAVISGYHRNAPLPGFDYVKNALHDSAESFGSALIIVNDGKPTVKDDYIYDEPKGAGGKLDDIIDFNVETTMDSLKKRRATTPEVDTLKAIDLAARSLSNYNGEKRLYILDSGLSTTGFLDFTKGLLNSEAEEIVAFLKENEALPNLEGITVTWVGLGEVAGEQEDLKPMERNKLIEIWEKILEASGAELKSRIESSGSKGEDYDELPAVTVVPTQKIEINGINGEIGKKEFNIFKINMMEGCFVADEATFQDISEAQENLKPVVEYLSEHPSCHVILAGTTASVGSNEYCKRLSLERANVTKDLMIEMGVSSEQIEDTVGLGYEHKFHVHDIDKNGNLTSNAQKNRAFIIVSTELEGAEYIISLK